MNPLMTRYRERHQIALIMRTTIAERLDVMDKRRERGRICPAPYSTRKVDAQPSVGRESYATRCRTSRVDRIHE